MKVKMKEVKLRSWEVRQASDTEHERLGESLESGTSPGLFGDGNEGSTEARPKHLEKRKR